jgi:hypothetical protein
MRQMKREKFLYLCGKKIMEQITAIETNLFGKLHPQLITDANGTQLVALPRQEFEFMLEEIDEWEDTLLLARAQADDDGERIPMEEVFSRIENNRKKQQQ